MLNHFVKSCTIAYKRVAYKKNLVYMPKQVFVFLLNDLHILQTTCLTNNNKTKNTIGKTKQHKQWTLCAIIKSENIIKTKEI